VGASLREALSALLAQDRDTLDVHADGVRIGVLTPVGLHAALRRSVAADSGVSGAGVSGAGVSGAGVSGAGASGAGEQA
jgi:hypothetical protein